MPETAAVSIELEIGIQRIGQDLFSISMIRRSANEEAEQRLERIVSFSPRQLALLEQDQPAYGRALGGFLLSPALDAQRPASPSLQQFFDDTSGRVGADGSLHVRLVLWPSVPDLHAWRWELLIHPNGTAPLFSGSRLLFSRYLSSQDAIPVKLRSRRTLRALLVIASPPELYEDPPHSRLAPFDVTRAVDTARACLLAGALCQQVTVLASTPPGTLPQFPPATLENITQHLNEGYDFVFLQCHGELGRQREPLLLLDPSPPPPLGEEVRPNGAALVSAIEKMVQRPQLVVLASCESGATGGVAYGEEDGALLALGPRLAAAGVPAVIAMHGRIPIPTLEAFTQRLLGELNQSGFIARAMGRARQSVHPQSGWWMPALYMRLRSGRLWTEALEPASDGETTGRIAKLVENIEGEMCTAILGPGLADSLLGSRREIARLWARKRSFPMDRTQQDSLPQVAQYLGTSNDNPQFPRQDLALHLIDQLVRQHGKCLPEDLYKRATGSVKPRDAGEVLTQLLQVLGRLARAGKIAGQQSPYAVMAALPLRTYITTDPTSLLVDALQAAGRTPQVDHCRWYGRRTGDRRILSSSFTPTVQEPLVFHLFGSLDHPHSLVLTEDDYFDYLIGVTREHRLIPPVVFEALVESSLMFVGFRLDDWEFRVFLRSILSLDGIERMRRFEHVAVQLDPDDEQVIDAIAAQRHMEKYFRKGAEIGIYWGSQESFLDALLSEARAQGVKLHKEQP